MTKVSLKKEIITHLETGLNIGQACKKTGVSRNTFYRWINDRTDFHNKVNSAKKIGVDVINDYTENQLLEEIRNHTWSAIKYRLDKRHPDYSRRDDIKGKLLPRNEIIYKDFSKLSPEEQASLENQIRH